MAFRVFRPPKKGVSEALPYERLESTRKSAPVVLRRMFHLFMGLFGIKP